MKRSRYIAHTVIFTCTVLLLIILLNSARADTIVTLTMPTQFVNGSPLPNQPLPVLIWQDGIDFPLAAAVAPPGETISIEVPAESGCFYATAWALFGDIAQQSLPSNTDCLVASCGTSCHQEQ